MRGYFQWFVDISLVCIATAFAVLLRDDFVIEPSRWLTLIPYLVATLAAAAVTLPAAGTSWSIWRLISLREALQIAVGAVVIVMMALGSTFAWNRLDGVPRALPIIQVMSIWCLLVGVRVALRLQHLRGDRPKQFVQPALSDPRDNILIVGLTRATDLYLKALQELPDSRIRVAGILATSQRHRGREADRVPVLGTADELDKVLRELEVAGVQIAHIVVGLPSSQIAPETMEALLEAERSSSIHLVFLYELLGLKSAESDPDRASSQAASDQIPDDALQVTDEEALALAARPYWGVKRAIDVVVAATALILTLPLLALAALLTLLSIGTPIMFWQQRPGLAGRPFRVYKFRTMKDAHDATGHRLPDVDRLTWVGMFLRRSRLDELPQLYSVLVGDMSLIGPRPLLPVDQSARHAARLMVRPGLTGWAQVMGGRIVSADDKAALDIWYLQNASLSLDLKIVLLTLRMVLVGERVSQDAITSAWRDLESHRHRDYDFQRAA